MLQFRRALVVGLALSVIVPSPSVLGKDDPAGKVRGRIQDYERAQGRGLHEEPRQQARDAVRETKFFHVVEHRTGDERTSVPLGRQRSGQTRSDA